MLRRALVGLDNVIGAGQGGFQGAKMSRLTLDWVLSPLSINAELQHDLRALRARSRDLVRNNAYARRFLQLLGANVVGPHGIRLQARTRSADGRPFVTVNTEIERAWVEWGQVGTCTADGRLSWVGVQRLLATTLGQDGEFLVRLVRGYPNEHAFALQIIDVDLLDESLNVPAGPGQNEIRMGVEVNAWTRPVAYHVWPRHPAEHGRAADRERIPASDMIHGFIPFRVGQARGIPWFHPVLLDTKMLDGYQEAELIASRMAAAKPGFFKMSEDAGPYQGPATEGTAQIPEEMEPGMLKQLPPGWEFQGWDPQHPVDAYDAFTKAILRSIASGLGVSYHSLANDLSGVNYSSARVGELADRDEWRALQVWTIEHVHARVYLEWLKMALLTGAVRLTSQDARTYARVAWRPRGWAWVDPRNELDASEKELTLGLNSRTRQAAEQGRDFEEICEELEDEQALMEEHGLELGPHAAPNPAAAGQPMNGNGNGKASSGGDDNDEKDQMERSRQRLLTSGRPWP